MEQWNDGYVTDVAYMHHYCQEATPAWLAMAVQMMGHRPPDLQRLFRFADLGCGNGTTALCVAASCPEAEVWGFDFNPAHIAAGRQAAAAAGLGNIQFVETSFAELADTNHNRLPMFDFLTAHGVWSWVSEANRRHLSEVFNRLLLPGGIAYVSYNTMAGWAAMVPVRDLMRAVMEAHSQRSDLALPHIFDTIDRLRQAGAHYFQANPGVEPILASIRGLDPRYLAHEYLNESWHPTTFSEVSEAMARAKCSYVGSAYLPDNVAAVSIPTGVATLIDAEADPRLKETLRDLGSTQRFRRDVYQRGAVPLTLGEQRRMLDAMSILGVGASVIDEIESTPPFGTVKVASELFRPILEALKIGPVTLAEAHRFGAPARRPLKDTLLSFAMLVGAGRAVPQRPAAPGTAALRQARAYNLALAQTVADGGDSAHIAAPAVGAAIRSGAIEVLAVQKLVSGAPATLGALVPYVQTVMDGAGHVFRNDGRVITDAGERHRIIEARVQEILDQRIGPFRILGVLDAGSA